MKQAGAKLEFYRRSIVIPLRNWHVDEPMTIEIHNSSPKERERILRLPFVITGCSCARARATGGFQIYTMQGI